MSKHRILSGLIIALTVLLLIPSPAAAIEDCAFINGSFQNGLTNWTQWHADSSSTGSGQSGLGRVLSSGDWDNILQATDLVEDDLLSVSLYARAVDPDDGRIKVVIYQDSAEPENIVHEQEWYTDSSTWKRYFAYFMVPETDTYYVRILVVATGDVWYDTASLSCGEISSCGFTNGSFQNGLTNWSQWHADSSSTAEGQSGLGRVLSSGWDNILQATDLVEDDVLRVSLYARAVDADDGRIKVVIYQNSTEPENIVYEQEWYTDSSVWKRYFYYFTVPETDTYYVRILIVSTGAVWYDTASLNCGETGNCAVDGSFTNGLTGWTALHNDSIYSEDGYPADGRHLENEDDYDVLAKAVYLTESDDLFWSLYSKAAEGSTGTVMVHLYLSQEISKTWGYGFYHTDWRIGGNLYAPWTVPETGLYGLELTVDAYDEDDVWFDTFVLYCE